MRLEDGISLSDIAGYISRHRRFAAWRDAGCAPARHHLCAGQSYRDFLEALIRDYARATGVEMVHAFVDHSPQNSFNLRKLRQIFSNLQFAHIIRDGRGVAASLMPQDWGPNDILETAEYWELNVAAGFAAADFMQDAARNLRFEALIGEDAETLNVIAKLAGAASFDTAYDNTSYCVPSYAGATHALVDKKPSPERSMAWRARLSERQVELFENAAGALLEALGYTLVFPRGSARKPGRAERASIMVKRWFAYRRNRRRMRARITA